MRGARGRSAATAAEAIKQKRRDERTAGAAARTLVRRGLTAALLALAALAGCGEKPTSEEHTARAETLLANGDVSAAVIELKKATQTNSNDANARLLLGQSYLKLADFAAAQRELLLARDLGAERAKLIGPLSQAWIALGNYTKPLREFPLNDGAPVHDRAAVLVAHGQAYGGLGMPNEAARRFQEVLAKDPQHLAALVGLGRLALQRKDYDAAQSFADRAIAEALTDLDALALKGDLAFARASFPEAEEAYQALHSAVPQNPIYERALVETQLAGGKVDQARAHLDALLKRAPRQADVNYLRAVVAYQERDFGTAKQRGNVVLGEVPDHLPSELIVAAAAFALGQYELAADNLRTYVASLPGDDNARRLYGATLLRLGRADEARRVLEPLAAKLTDDADVLAAIGSAAVLSGDLRSAAKYFEQITRLQPDNAAAVAQLGAIKLSFGQEEHGLKELEQAIEQDPNLDQAQVTLVLAYLKRREFERAIAMAEKMQVRFPANPIGATTAGVACAGKGDFAEAKAWFRKALAIRPGAPDASANLAALELREGNTDQALAILGEALEKNPDDLRIVLGVARLENQISRGSAAKTRLKDYARAHPEVLAPRLVLAQLHLHDREPQKALDVTESQLAIHPDNPILLAVIGLARLGVGRVEDGTNTLRTLVHKRPASADAHALLAQAYRHLGDQRSYRAELERSLELNPHRLSSKLDLASLAAQQGDMGTAERLLSELKHVIAEDARVIELEGAIAVLQNRPAEAIALFKKTAEMRPSDRVILKLADAQRRAGDAAGARATLDTWLAEHPADGSVRIALANWEFTERQYDAARTRYTEVIRLKPNDVAARNNLAWLYWSAGDAKAALPHVERALELAPGNAAVMDTAGVVYLKLGKADRASELLRNAASKLPASGDVQYHFAQALVAQGRMDEAREALKRALATVGTFTGHAEAEALMKQIDG